MTTTTARPVDPARLTPRLRAILAVVLIADVLDLMDSTITNIAAPTIVGEIGGGESLIKWLGASYALAMGVLLVVGGRLGDRYGKRRTFLLGMVGFGLASVACGLAPDPTVLVVARLFQGGFGALLIPQGIGLLIATFSREQFPTAASAFGPVLGGSAVAGPVLAGFIIDADIAGLTWRPMFLVNIVLTAVGLVFAWRILPHDEPDPSVRIDIAGSALLGGAMLGVLYGLIDGSTSGWATGSVAALIAGAVFMALFAWRQATAPDPLILPSLLRNRGYTSGLLLGLAYFAAVNGFAYVVALFFQSALDLSPAGAALALAPLMVGIMGSSLVARPLVARLGRRLVLIGLAVSLTGIVGLLVTAQLAGPDLNQWLMAPAVVVLGAGMGACFASIYDVAVGNLAPEEAGSASGSLSAIQQLANAIGAAMVTTVYFQQVSSSAHHALVICLAVVGGLVLLASPLVALMPERAAEDAH